MNFREELYRLDKQSFFTTLLVSVFIFLIFVLEIKSDLSTAVIGGFLFISVVSMGLIGTFIFKKYKGEQVSPPIVLTTYVCVIIVLIIAINNVQ